MNVSSEERLLQLVGDYISGSFTIQGEEPLMKEIISLVSSNNAEIKLSSEEVFTILFEGDVETPKEGVVALRAFVQAKQR